MYKEMEQTLDELIRPQLLLHGGGIRILDLQEDVLYLELLGVCSGCPSATLTTAPTVKEKLLQAVPHLKDVVLVDRVNEDLLAQARAMLSSSL